MPLNTEPEMRIASLRLSVDNRGLQQASCHVRCDVIGDRDHRAKLCRRGGWKRPKDWIPLLSRTLDSFCSFPCVGVTLDLLSIIATVILNLSASRGSKLSSESNFDLYRYTFESLGLAYPLLTCTTTSHQE